MNLTEALTKLKNLKSKISRVEERLNECATHYEDTVPPFDYESELNERVRLVEEIRKLKGLIQRTNATTKVTWEGKEITLTDLILLNADLRSEMAFLNRQMQHTTEVDRWGRASRSKDEIPKVFAKGCDKALFSKTIDLLEQQKEQLEKVLGQVNASTELVTQ